MLEACRLVRSPGVLSMLQLFKAFEVFPGAFKRQEASVFRSNYERSQFFEVAQLRVFMPMTLRSIQCLA